jgi:hypothetical protein
MSETSHTPGPWVAVLNGGDDEDTRDLLVGKYGRSGFTVIADCRSRWVADDVGGDEEANAYLIAAAPDMLLAGKHLAVKLAECYRAAGVDPKECQAIRDWMTIAAKAEGR